MPDQTHAKSRAGWRAGGKADHSQGRGVHRAGDLPGPKGTDQDAAIRLIEAMADPLALLDLEGCLVFMNAAAERFCGYKKEEMIGRQFHDLLGEMTKEEESEEINRAVRLGLAEGKTTPLEFTFVSRDCREVPLWANASFVRDEQGEPWGVVVTFRDMSEKKRSEAVLSESEARFRALFEGSLDAVVLFDPDSGRILDANPAAYDLLSIPPEEILGMEHGDLYPPRLRERARHTFADQVLERQPPHPIETVLLAADGREVPVEVLAQVIQVNGTPALLATFRDISERKQAQEALLRSEERYRLLVENSSDVIVLLDADGTVRYVSPALERFIGYRPEEMVGRFVFDYVHPEDVGYIEGGFRRSLERPGDLLFLEFRFRHRNGTYRVLECVGRNLLDHPALGAVLVNCRDVTERKEAERALASLERRYRDLYENLRSGCVATDREGRITDCNPAFREMLGYDEKEILGLSREQITPERWHGLDERIIKEQLLVRGYSDIYEKEYVRKDGALLPVEIRAYLIRDGEAEGIGMWEIVEDLSDRRRMEEELLKAQRLESLGVLCGGLAHDFNNILTAILTNISMARMYGQMDDETAKMLGDAETASLRGKGLTHQLLAFAKGGEPVKEPLALEGLLKDTVEFALSGSNVRCEYELSQDLWVVEADKGQIGQVFQNLVLNADQAMPGGGTMRVRARNVRVREAGPSGLAPGAYVQVSIVDQGIGIPEEHLSRVFDPFFTTKQKGSGLGLSTAYSVVRRHGGLIEIDSRLGAGTAVHVYLPASPGVSVEGRAEGGRPVRGAGRVLLVDDDEALRSSTGAALRRMGYEVEETGDGEAAIRAYQEARRQGRPIDVVIMDLTIPGGMGGREAAQRLLESDPGARVVVSSGYSNDPVMSRFREHGFQAVITKPYRLEDLSETLRVVLADRRG